MLFGARDVDVLLEDEIADERSVGRSSMSDSRSMFRARRRAFRRRSEVEFVLREL